MGPEPHSATDRGSTTAARVLAAATPERWGPSYFGVIPEGGVRRRASDAVQLVLASLLIAICAVVTHGFAARDDGFYEWLSDLPSWFDAARHGAVPVLHDRRGDRGGAGAAALAEPPARPHPGRGRGAHGPARRRPCPASSTWTRSCVPPESTRAPCRPSRWCGWRWRPRCCSPSRPTSSVRRAGSCTRCSSSRCSVRCSRRWRPSPPILAAVGLGWWISALVSLVIGTPKATPTLHSVVQALSALGISVDQLALADHADVGRDALRRVAPPTVRPPSIVVIGRDGADARLVSKLWRSTPLPGCRSEHRGHPLGPARAPRLHAPHGRQGGRTGERGRDRRPRAGGTDTALLVLLDPDGRPLSELDADRPR